MLRLKNKWIVLLLIAFSATLEAWCQDTCLTVPEIKGIAYKIKTGEECEKILLHNDSVNSEIISLQRISIGGLTSQNKNQSDLIVSMSDQMKVMDKNLDKANTKAFRLGKFSTVEAIVIAVLSLIIAINK